MKSSLRRGSIPVSFRVLTNVAVSHRFPRKTQIWRSSPLRCITPKISNQSGCKTRSANGNFRLVKLKALLGDTEQELSLEVVDGRVSARIGARHYDLEVREIEDGHYLFFLENRVRELRVDDKIKIIDPKRLRSGQNSDGHHHGVAEIVAQMPGKVVRVQVEAGTPVEKGAGVI